MSRTRYRGGIAQKCAICRGRREAGVRYLARQAAISPVAWTNGTKAVQHSTRLEGSLGFERDVPSRAPVKPGDLLASAATVR